MYACSIQLHLYELHFTVWLQQTMSSNPMAQATTALSIPSSNPLTSTLPLLPSTSLPLPPISPPTSEAISPFSSPGSISTTSISSLSSPLRPILSPITAPTTPLQSATSSSSSLMSSPLPYDMPNAKLPTIA